MCKHYHPAEEVPMFSFAQMLGNRIRPRRSSSAKSRKTRLQVEALEERAVPTVVIVPQFGPETIAPGSTNDGMQHPAVNLIFSGKYWNTIEGQQDETTLLNSVQSILSGPYLSRLTQYGSDGKANLGKAWIDTGTVSIKSGGTSPSAQGVQNFLNTSISRNNADPGLFNDWQHTPIYVVVSDPASSGGHDDGWNARGTYWKWGFIPEQMHMIWLGTVSSDVHVVKDSFTDVFSHELVETISDPDSNGIRVNPPAGLPPYLKGDHQIGDNEPDGGRYLYKLDGNLVQAYWSRQDQAFVVPDGNVQNFTLVPIWSYELDGDIYTLTFNDVYNLEVVGDQRGVNYPDQIQIGAGAAPYIVSVSMNNESAVFDEQLIKAINVDTGGGSNNVRVSTLPFGATLNLDSSGLNSNDSVVIGANSSLAKINGTINISNHFGQSSVFINASMDVAQTVTITDHSVAFSRLSTTINYDAGYLDPAGNKHGVTSLTIDQAGGSTIYAESVGVFTDTSVYWEPDIYGTRLIPGKLRGPAASKIHVIGPFIEP
jgi:hypothetical protein